MIRKITDPGELDFDLLCRSWRGRNIYAYYKAYGLNYDFCEFYQVGENGILLRFNSTVLIVNADPGEIMDLTWLLRMMQPFRIESDLAGDLSGFLPEYILLHRTTFQLQPGEKNLLDAQQEEACIDFNPDLKQVYQILQAGFPHLQDYTLWLTDTSHRCRHGISHVLTYKNSTTASMLFDIENHVLIGQVATRPEARGLGHARLFLRWLAGWLAQMDKTAVLYALDIRRSFYQEIGFLPVAEEFVLERSEPEKNNSIITKGLLENA